MEKSTCKKCYDKRTIAIKCNKTEYAMIKELLKNCGGIEHWPIIKANLDKKNKALDKQKDIC